MTNLFFIQNYLFSALILTLIIMILIHFHPILLMIILIYWNIILILNMSLYKSMFIYPIMFFIIMISGLLISLLYFASMISNEKAFLNLFSLYKWLLVMLLPTLLIIKSPHILKMKSPEGPPSNSLLQFISSLQNNDHYTMFKMINPPLMNLNVMYSHPLNNLTTMSILYLLITLMVIIKICSPKNMTMRKLS